MWHVKQLLMQMLFAFGLIVHMVCGDDGVAAAHDGLGDLHKVSVKIKVRPHPSASASRDGESPE